VSVCVSALGSATPTSFPPSHFVIFNHAPFRLGIFTYAHLFSPSLFVAFTHAYFFLLFTQVYSHTLTSFPPPHFVTFTYAHFFFSSSLCYIHLRSLLFLVVSHLCRMESKRGRMFMNTCLTTCTSQTSSVYPVIRLAPLLTRW
jgi:hypothetical protein